MSKKDVKDLQWEVTHQTDQMIDFMNNIYEMLDVFTEALMDLQQQMHGLVQALEIDFNIRSDKISELEKKVGEMKNKEIYI